LVPPPLVPDEVESFVLEGRPVEELSLLEEPSSQPPSLWQMLPLGQ